MEHIKVSVSEELDLWLKERAATEQRSLSSMIRVLLYEAKLREEETALA